MGLTLFFLENTLERFRRFLLLQPQRTGLYAAIRVIASLKPLSTNLATLQFVGDGNIDLFALISRSESTRAPLGAESPTSVTTVV